MNKKLALFAGAWTCAILPTLPGFGQEPLQFAHLKAPRISKIENPPLSREKPDKS